MSETNTIHAILVENGANAKKKRIDLFPIDAATFTATTASMWLLGLFGRSPIPTQSHFVPWVHNLIVIAILLFILEILEVRRNLKPFVRIAAAIKKKGTVC